MAPGDTPQAAPAEGQKTELLPAQGGSPRRKTLLRGRNVSDRGYQKGIRHQGYQMFQCPTGFRRKKGSAK